MENMILKLNATYSVIWMKCTGKDKYSYREESKVHNFLVKVAYNLAKKGEM